MRESPTRIAAKEGDEHSSPTPSHKRGVRQLQLGVNESNLPALSLYQSQGLEPYGREKDALKIGREFHHEFLMALPL